LFWEFDIWLVLPSDTIGPRPLLLFRLEVPRYVEEAKNSTRLEVEAPTVQREGNIFQKYKIIHWGSLTVGRTGGRKPWEAVKSSKKFLKPQIFNLIN
jgi:hypothetical protein